MQSMTRSNHVPFFTLSLLLIAAIVLLTADPAFAQSSENWAATSVKKIDDVTAQIMKIAGALLALALVVIGIVSAITQRVNWIGLLCFFLGGLIATVAPHLVVWAFNTSAGA